MEKIFQLSAVVLAGVAAYFLWVGNSEYAFVAGVLGCVSFLLSVRTQIKVRTRVRELERQKELNRQDAEGELVDSE